MKTYCNSLINYSRFKSRVVRIGNVAFGGDNPIRVQSMTTTDTMDTEATVAESIRMIEAGCELVRITAPSKKEAENLANIKAELLKRGYDTPLVADIHFTPNAAEIAATIVEKVRVNPGNYADKKKFEELEYTDATYQAELERIRERFTPLVKICKAYGTAMRIGTNHGSLSDRILSRYGDTPEGMVESAMEFLYICRDFDYHDIILSMKASNTQVMVQAYRLLVARMIEEDMNYPLHLGVTEAGEGEDGRIKSAVGIGTLLEDGLGDTVRVSLTEAPEAEMPVAKLLVDRYANRKSAYEEEISSPLNPFTYTRRDSKEVLNIGHKGTPVVIADLSKKEEIKPANLFAVGYNYAVSLDKWNIGDLACDYLYVGGLELGFEIPGTLAVIQELKAYSGKDRHYPISSDLLALKETTSAIKFLTVCAEEVGESELIEIGKTQNIVIVLESHAYNAMAQMRKVFLEMHRLGIASPVILKRTFHDLSPDAFQLYASTDCGALLLDGFGDGVWLKADQSLQLINQTCFGVLQATRTRISKTEYISCPSCGRTLFDLQETTAKIRNRTSHLKGIKIGIMGCIVNGPGEMADADYGYVGTGVGKITLYKEKEVVKRNVPSEHAVDELIALIQDHGDWVEPKQ
ncbi:MAG: (E)-4-hydroxy-3-methylbut-2-enyl-diphosphate synthase [Flavobacteriales bacterium]|jgi:(E)-4-hydroxy-3-methylbut-2-enyl-diphosphate synthase